MAETSETRATKVAQADEIRLAPVSTADERKAAVEKEYGQYVATQEINSPSGARAFNVGDPIPASTVEKDHCDWIAADHETVAKAGTVAAKKAIRQAAGLSEEGE